MTSNELRMKLAKHAAEMGCKPVFGGHDQNCRCFSIRIEIQDAIDAELKARLAWEAEQPW